MTCRTGIRLTKCTHLSISYFSILHYLVSKLILFVAARTFLSGCPVIWSSRNKTLTSQFSMCDHWYLWLILHFLCSVNTCLSASLTLKTLLASLGHYKHHSSCTQSSAHSSSPTIPLSLGTDSCLSPIQSCLWALL